MAWPEGLTWTKGYYDEKKQMRVQSGPFFYDSNILGLEVYIGFRPTAPAKAGTGNEGDLGFGWFGRFMKNVGLGNFGIAIRRAKD